MLHITALLLMVAATIAPSQSQGIRRPISKIEIRGGRSSHEGYVVIQFDGSMIWRFVCDDGFGFAEADAVCRDVGYEGADRFNKNNYFGSNMAKWRRKSPEFLLDRLICSSTAASYKDCPIAEPSVHDCAASEIAGVECRTTESQCLPDEFPCRGNSLCIPRDQVCDGISQCPDNSDDAVDLCNDIYAARVRSNIDVNIPGAVLGSVQVKYNEEWGVVCDDTTSQQDVKVICNTMGYGGGWAVPFTASYFGEVKGNMVVDSPGCDGTESWLGECPGIEWGVTDCPEENEDLGVFCYNEEVEVRLVENESPSSGRVEMKMAGRWGSVCGVGFDIFDAQAICLMLGYDGDAIAHRDSGLGSGPIWDLRLDCLGNEQDIQECRVRIVNETCPLYNTAGVTCSHGPGKIDADLRAALGNVECGIPEDASNQFITSLAKVRGGRPPSRFDTPWLVSLRLRKEIGGDLACGGVIISEDYVLTAAHCLSILGRLTVVVRVGDYNSEYEEESEEEFSLDKYWTHEYEEELGFSDNDIALIKIERKNGRGIVFGPRVKPICLPSIHDNYDDVKKCTVVGWGPTYFLNVPTTRPREAETDIAPDYLCEGSFGGPENYTSSLVCVLRLSPRVNACKGDSGGPLACLVRGSQTLYGLVSTGRGCTFVTSADLYTRVTKFLGWILDKVQLSSRNV